MSKKTSYVSKKPDSDGSIAYTEEENETWGLLYQRQLKAIQGKACESYLEGLDTLALPQDHIPQLDEINQRLKTVTGWEVARVPALIPFDRFFALMADKKFPAATFIRRREELDYLQEPDIFHEVFGHCPLLACPMYAAFMHAYGQMGAKTTHKNQVMLARFYWFTVEFGLINTTQGLRIYGSGILSSPGETHYSLTSDKPEHRKFDPLDILRTPYRIDIFQSKYFIIEEFNQLYDAMNENLFNTIEQARSLGMHAPTFPEKDGSSTY